VVEFSWKESIRPFFRDRRFLISHAKAEYARPLVELLGDLGAEPPFVLVGAGGTGGLEDLEIADVVDLALGPFVSAMDELRTTYAAFDALPNDVLSRIDAWDSDMQAQVLSLFHQVATPLAGRYHYGTRPPEWMVLDDKTTIDELWRDMGVDHARSVVVDPQSGAAVIAAFQDVASEHGVVVAADSTDGWHGGADRTRWATTVDESVAAALELSPYAQYVRLMPFLEGIPCGITGIVFPERVAALRPAEMLVLRMNGRFQYAGTASVWRPSPPDVAAMRRLTKRVGVFLRENHDYRGHFTIDGVLTSDGFVPTELNPRMGGAAMRLRTGLDVSLRMIDRVLIAAEEVDLQPALLERTVLDSSLRPASAGGFVRVPEAPDAPVERWWDGTGVVASEPEGAAASVHWTADGPGGAIGVKCDVALLEVGAPFAPVLVEIAKAFASKIGLDVEPFEAARSERKTVSTETVAHAVRQLANASVGVVETEILREALDVSGHERLLSLREALVRTRNAWERLDDKAIVAMARSAIATGKVLGVEE
jgi:hypothetical protein